MTARKPRDLGGFGYRFDGSVNLHRVTTLELARDHVARLADKGRVAYAYIRDADGNWQRVDSDSVPEVATVDPLLAKLIAHIDRDHQFESDGCGQIPGDACTPWCASCKTLADVPADLLAAVRANRKDN